MIKINRFSAANFNLVDKSINSGSLKESFCNTESSNHCILIVILLHIAVLSFFLVLSYPIYAVEPDEILKNEALELRARKISSNLRCLVCQNQSIDDSDAALARDLRMLVRERLVAGDDDKDVIEYVVSRYGNFVLLHPPFKPITYFLWLGPIVIFVLAFLGIVIFFRNKKNGKLPKSVGLSAEEKIRLEKLIAESGK